MNKKICFVVYNFSDYGGVNSIVAEKINELSDAYEITLISIIGDERKTVYELKNNIRVVSLLKQSSSLRKEFFEVFIPAYNFLKRERFDTVFCEGHYPGFLLCLLQRFISSRMVFVDHGALMNQWDEKKVTFMRRIASKVCSHTVTLTERTKNDYIEKFSIPSNKIQCIYNWIDSKKQRTIKYNLESKKIMSVGRFGREKGFDQLIEAFSLVAEKHPDWELDIYGDGETMPLIKQLVKEKQLENNVHLLGMQMNVVDCYQDYAMYVLPSYREGLPLVLLEAKINKLPIVSFDILTGPREIIRDNVDGLLVNPKDVVGMANAVCELIETPSLRKEMSDKTLENIQKFSKESILQKWIDLIENV